MKIVEFSPEEMVAKLVGDIQDPAIKCVIAGDCARRYCILTKAADCQAWFWSTIEAGYSTMDIHDHKDFSTPEKAIAFALLQDQTVFVMENITEFCEWFIEQKKAKK